MKLLILSERAGTPGGVESYVGTTSDGLRALGHDVRISTRAELDWSDEHDSGSPAAAARLRSIAADFRPDCIALHNVLDAAVIDAARESCRASVYHIHDHRLFCPNGDRVYPHSGKRCGAPMGAACVAHAIISGCAYGPRISTLRLLQIRRATRDAALRCGRIVVHSEFMRAVASRNGVAQASIDVLDPPLADDFYSALAPQPQQHRVLFAARVVPSKGLQHLVRALALLPAGKRPVLRVAGDGPDLTPSIALAVELNCKIESSGALTRRDLIEALDTAALFAMPSLWDEPFGLAGVEAFARARPVAAYSSGAIPDWIGEGGIAVPTGDIGALARAIETLLEPKRWAAAANSARTIAQRFTLERALPELLGVYAATARYPSHSDG